jgi:beta-lactam-binding protein with PASTA domain
MIDDTPTALLLGHIVTSREAPPVIGPSITIPHLAGVEEGAAVHQLKNLGLPATITPETDLTVALSLVISQRPGPGTIATPGETVQLVVRAGKTPGSGP